MLKKLLFLCLLSNICILTSCEIANERLSKKLIQKGGTWDIELINWSRVQRGLVDSISSGTARSGMFKFHSNGNVQYNYPFLNAERNGVCTWQAAETQLIIDYVDLPDIPFPLLSVVYDIEHVSNNEIILSTTESYTDELNHTISNTVSIELKRRN